ncbi:MAG: hypothetical protein WAP52_02640 [Candidatus Sungiibacteriota bacterium]
MPTYACAAATVGKARCRNAATKEGRCHEHPAATLAPPPDVVLMKFSVNKRRAQELAATGIPIRDVNWQRREQEHVAHAEAHDRQAYRYREVADSGVPIFGTSGLADVGIGRAYQELNQKYGLRDVHLLPHRNLRAFVLVLVFERGAQAVNPSTEVAVLLARMLNSAYGFVHVWANPPQQDGKVVHTMNCRHRLDSAPKCLLLLNNEWFDAPLWDAEEVQ